MKKLSFKQLVKKLEELASFPERIYGVENFKLVIDWENEKVRMMIPEGMHVALRYMVIDELNKLIMVNADHYDDAWDYYEPSKHDSFLIRRNRYVIGDKQ